MQNLLLPMLLHIFQASSVGCRHCISSLNSTDGRSNDVLVIPEASNQSSGFTSADSVYSEGTKGENVMIKTKDSEMNSSVDNNVANPAASTTPEGLLSTSVSVEESNNICTTTRNSNFDADFSSSTSRKAEILVSDVGLCSVCGHSVILDTDIIKFIINQVLTTSFSGTHDRYLHLKPESGQSEKGSSSIDYHINEELKVELLKVNICSVLLADVYLYVFCAHVGHHAHARIHVEATC
jgi:hypothetical protein